eukprot:gene2842-6542_t
MYICQTDGTMYRLINLNSICEIHVATPRLTDGEGGRQPRQQPCREVLLKIDPDLGQADFLYCELHDAEDDRNNGQPKCFCAITALLNSNHKAGDRQAMTVNYLPPGEHHHNVKLQR